MISAILTSFAEYFMLNNGNIASCDVTKGRVDKLSVVGVGVADTRMGRRCSESFNLLERFLAKNSSGVVKHASHSDAILIRNGRWYNKIAGFLRDSSSNEGILDGANELGSVEECFGKTESNTVWWWDFSPGVAPVRAGKRLLISKSIRSLTILRSFVTASRVAGRGGKERAEITLEARSGVDSSSMYIRI